MHQGRLVVARRRRAQLALAALSLIAASCTDEPGEAGGTVEPADNDDATDPTLIEVNDSTTTTIEQVVTPDAPDAPDPAEHPTCVDMSERIKEPIAGRDFDRAGQPWTADVIALSDFQTLAPAVVFTSALETLGSRDWRLTSHAEVARLFDLSSIAAQCLLFSGADTDVLMPALAGIALPTQSARDLAAATLAAGRGDTVSIALRGSPRDAFSASRMSPLALRNLNTLDSEVAVVARTNNVSAGDSDDDDRNILLGRALRTFLLTPPTDLWATLGPDLQSDQTTSSALLGTTVARVMLEADVQLKSDAASLWNPDLVTGSWVAGAFALSPGCKLEEFRNWIDISEGEYRRYGRAILVQPVELRVHFAVDKSSGDCDAIKDVNTSVLLPALDSMVNSSPEYSDLRVLAAARVAAEAIRIEGLEGADASPKDVPIDPDGPGATANTPTLTSRIFASSLAPAAQSDLREPDWSERETLQSYLDAYQTESYYSAGDGEQFVAYFASGGIDMRSPSVQQSESLESSPKLITETIDQCENSTPNPFPPLGVDPIFTNGSKGFIPGFDAVLDHFTNEKGNALGNEELAEKVGSDSQFGKGISESPETGTPNICSLRMSYALAEAGSPVQPLRGNVYVDGSGRSHLRSAARLGEHLNDLYGKSALSARLTTHAGRAKYSEMRQLEIDLKKSDDSGQPQRGILWFRYKDGTGVSGHVDLWDGTGCVSLCYFPGQWTTKSSVVEVRFFPLPKDRQPCPPHE